MWSEVAGVDCHYERGAVCGKRGTQDSTDKTSSEVDRDTGLFEFEPTKVENKKENDHRGQTQLQLLRTGEVENNETEWSTNESSQQQPLDSRSVAMMTFGPSLTTAGECPERCSNYDCGVCGNSNRHERHRKQSETESCDRLNERREKYCDSDKN